MKTGRNYFAACGASMTALMVGALIAALLQSPDRAPADAASRTLAKYAKPVDASIDRALAYLAKNQLEDGSFNAPSMPGSTAVTSLSVMAFLAKGYTPSVGPYGKTIDRGVDYILASQIANGLLVGKKPRSHGPMYEHGISTLMLSEVSGMVTPARQKKLDVVLAKAMKLILSAQKMPKAGIHKGGWRYQPTSRNSDISCSGWSLMALRSARNNGAAVPTEAIEAGVKYVLGLRCADGGFGYSAPKGPGLARTGTALLCLELCGKHGHAATLGAGEWILKHLPSKVGGGHFYYGLYYCSQGMFQLGGKYWETWARRMYDMMLKFQRKDGSWPPAASTAGKAGPCYSTAMSVLAMSVSYRQLPIYQR